MTYECGVRDVRIRRRALARPQKEVDCTSERYREAVVAARQTMIGKRL